MPLVEIEPTAAVLALWSKATLVFAEHFGVKELFTKFVPPVTWLPVPVVQTADEAAIAIDEATHNDTAIMIFFILWVP